VSYIFKFNRNDIFVNTIEANPRVDFQIYSGSAYYNNRTAISGAFTSSVVAPPGHLSLYEMNVDRSGLVAELEGNHAHLAGTDATAHWAGENPRIHSFVVKDGTRLSFRTATTAQFNSATQFGAHIYKQYPLVSSLHREFYYPTTARTTPSRTAPSETGDYPISSGAISHLYALKTTMNHYTRLSPHYAYTSSRGDLSWDKETQYVNLVSVPSIFYGSAIEKGTVDLKFYITGTLIGQLQDIRRNGELIQVAPRGSTRSGSIAGTVLYNEGFLILTGSWPLSSSAKEEYFKTNSQDYPRWVHFASCLSQSAETTPSSSYSLNFNGTTRTPTMTMMAHAKKGMLNHSNNPTYVKYGESAIPSTGSNGYIENTEKEIKNIVKSPYNDPTGSFKKVTYITKIGIYDENKNLIGIAKLANPVKKTEERAFTFKLKLDI